MANVNQVLVISPEKEHHEKITAAMNRCGLISVCCMKFDEARIFMNKEKFGVVFCHETLPDGDFRGAEWDHYLAALRAGAFDYIACPPDSAETERILRSAMGNAREVAADAVH
jgi:DNA-binding NtrC family response regulator